MESTKESQSDDEDEGEEEEEEEGEEGEGGDEREQVGVSERAEVERGVEDVGVGSNVEESEHEDEEEPDGSAKLWQADSEEANEASRASPASPSPIEQLSSKVESTLSVKGGGSKEQEIREKAANEAYKRRAREKQKYHSRRGAERIGRAKGSKAKQDNRVKLDKGGLWD